MTNAGLPLGDKLDLLTAYKLIRTRKRGLIKSDPSWVMRKMNEIGKHIPRDILRYEVQPNISIYLEAKISEVGAGY